MSVDYIFLLSLVGTLIASFQDFKRREIDRWLTYCLLISGVFYLLVNIIVNKDVNLLFQSFFVYGVMFGLSNLLYYAKFFAGGDSNLLFSISALFVGQTFLISILNIITFLIILMISGSIYGMIYSGYLYFRYMKKANVEIRYEFKRSKLKWMLLVSIPFGIISLFNLMFLPFFVVLVLTPVLFVFVRSLESVALTKKISTKDLRLGDWIKDDVSIGKNKIRSSFYGLNEDELKLLKENNTEVYIKDGIPFAFAFTLSLIISMFLSEKIITLIFRIFI